MEITGTARINFELEKMIKESEEYLIFLSPYLKIGQKLRNLIIREFTTIEKIFILCRLKDLSIVEKNFFESNPKIKLIDCPKLHAKCYLNEKRIILTSMNLYDFSQINNFELGVIINHHENEISYRSVLQEIELMLKIEDEKSLKLIGFLNDIINYRFTELTAKIIKNYILPIGDNNKPDNKYKYLSQEAMKFHSFKHEELYQDKSAVLRSTTISNKEFNFIYKKITSNLKRKK